jgi:hypothetical protein
MYTLEFNEVTTNYWPTVRVSVVDGVKIKFEIVLSILKTGEENEEGKCNNLYYSTYK